MTETPDTYTDETLDMMRTAGAELGGMLGRYAAARAVFDKAFDDAAHGELQLAGICGCETRDETFHGNPAAGRAAAETELVALVAQAMRDANSGEAWERPWEVPFDRFARVALDAITGRKPAEEQLRDEAKRNCPWDCGCTACNDGGDAVERHRRKLRAPVCHCSTTQHDTGTELHPDADCPIHGEASAVCQQRAFHGNPFRYCACGWHEPAVTPPETNDERINAAYGVGTEQAGAAQ